MDSLYIRGYADANFGMNVDRSSQIGYCILSMDKFDRFAIIKFQSGKCHRVTPSAMAAEACAFAEGFEAAFVLKHSFENLIKRHIRLQMLTDSKQLFDAISHIRKLEALGAVCANPTSLWASPALAVPKAGLEGYMFTVTFFVQTHKQSRWRPVCRTWSRCSSPSRAADAFQKSIFVMHIGNSPLPPSRRIFSQFKRRPASTHQLDSFKAAQTQGTTFKELQNRFSSNKRRSDIVFYSG
jgi:hypothetical protein